jgi:hypothetical protein
MSEGGNDDGGVGEIPNMTEEAGHPIRLTVLFFVVWGWFLAGYFTSKHYGTNIGTGSVVVSFFLILLGYYGYVRWALKGEAYSHARVGWFAVLSYCVQLVVGVFAEILERPNPMWAVCIIWGMAGWLLIMAVFMQYVVP